MKGFQRYFIYNTNIYYRLQNRLLSWLRLGLGGFRPILVFSLLAQFWRHKRLVTSNDVFDECNVISCLVSFTISNRRRFTLYPNINQNVLTQSLTVDQIFFYLSVANVTIFERFFFNFSMLSLLTQFNEWLAWLGLKQLEPSRILYLLYLCFPLLWKSLDVAAKQKLFIEKSIWINNSIVIRVS